MVDWRSNKAVGIAAVIVLLIGVYLIWSQVTRRKGPRKTMWYICTDPGHPDGGRWSVDKNSKFWQEHWLGRGQGPGPCPMGHGDKSYAASVCAECGHLYLDSADSTAPAEFTSPYCPLCAKEEEGEEEEEEEEED